MTATLLMRAWAISATLLCCCVPGTLGSAYGAQAAGPEPLSDADLGRILPLVLENYFGAEKLLERDLTRATLPAFLDQLGPAIQILPSSVPSAPAIIPFYSEILLENIGYVRLGTLTRPNLTAMDAALNEFPSKRVQSVILDLRATPASQDFDSAGEVIKRFTPKGKVLFSLHRANPKNSRIVTSKDDPVFSGRAVVLMDGNTEGAGEVIAAVLGVQAKAMIIGEPTKGMAAEFVEVALPSGKAMQVATGEVVIAGTASIFPGTLKPDLAVPVPPASAQAAMKAGLEKGVKDLVIEVERPHMNEAALVAGTNPELEPGFRGRGASGKLPFKDMILQRAVDFVAASRVYIAP